MAEAVSRPDRRPGGSDHTSIDEQRPQLRHFAVGFHAAPLDYREIAIGKRQQGVMPDPADCAGPHGECPMEKQQTYERRARD